MRTSLIINTACGDPFASAVPTREAMYEDRYEYIKRIISEFGGVCDEIVIAGKLPDGELEGVCRYIELIGGYGDRRDALLQREMGARASTGDVLIFTHDDHLPRWTRQDIEEEYGGSWDILVPKRIHGITGEVLNNGRENGYMGGHTLVMKRDTWIRIPWVTVIPERCWDLPFTKLWKQEGVTIAYSDILKSVDLEAKAHEV